MFRKSLLSTVTLLAFGGSAFAADLPSRAPPPVYVPPPPIFTWTGLYVGGDIGYRWGTSTSNLFPTGIGPGAGTVSSFSPNGITGGAHLGYNYQFGMLVVGVEGNVDGSSYRGTQALGAGTLTTRSDIDASIRGRLGFAWDRALIYSTGGVAFAPFRNQFVSGGAVDDQNTMRTGWTVGGGVEYALSNNWSVRAEYRYTDYGRYTELLANTTGGAASVSKRETDNTVRAGFSYKFDMFAPPGPAVAKY